MANRLLADRDASPVGKRWAVNFVKRQPELKARFQRRYNYQRATYEDPLIIGDRFKLVQNTIAKYGTMQYPPTSHTPKKNLPHTKCNFST